MPRAIVRMQTLDSIQSRCRQALLCCHEKLWPTGLSCTTARVDGWAANLGLNHTLTICLLLGGVTAHLLTTRRRCVFYSLLPHVYWLVVDNIVIASKKVTQPQPNQTQDFLELLYGHAANYQSRGTFHSTEQLPFTGTGRYRDIPMSDPQRPATMITIIVPQLLSLSTAISATTERNTDLLLHCLEYHRRTYDAVAAGNGGC